MARDRLASDITPGSIWGGPDGASACVVSTSAGYVVFEDGASGAIQTLHHLRFRERYLEPYDARRCRSQFSMSLANLASFHAFWSPSQRRMYARSATLAQDQVRDAARGRPALPQDAVFVGTYSAAVIAEPRWHRRGLSGVEAFFDDLHDVLRRFARRIGNSAAA